jgi:hypothetical protein
LVEHIAHIEIINAYNIKVLKSEEKKPKGKPDNIFDNNIKMEL